jgi:hypothetical protein
VAVLESGSFDPARVTSDQVVVDRRCEDRVQDPIRLRDRRSANAGDEPVGPPGPHLRGGDGTEPHVAEVRQDVQSKEPLVLLSRPGLQITLGDPAFGVLA